MAVAGNIETFKHTKCEKTICICLNHSAFYLRLRFCFLFLVPLFAFRVKWQPSVSSSVLDLFTLLLLCFLLDMRSVRGDCAYIHTQTHTHSAPIQLLQSIEKLCRAKHLLCNVEFHQSQQSQGQFSTDNSDSNTIKYHLLWWLVHIFQVISTISFWFEYKKR